MMDSRVVPLEEVFAPRSVAVVGASEARASFASGVVQSLIEAGFPAIYPVNPRYQQVLGLRCYPSVTSIPGTVDYVIVSVPATAALQLLDDCADKGVKAVQFFTAGFGETGFSDRADLERQMLEKARSGGFRIIGPNCTGVFVPRSRLTNGAGLPLEPGPIAFISQSGGHAHTLPAEGGPRGLRFSTIVSYGNALDVDECELLDYVSADPETGVIAAYIEGVRDGRRFAEALRAAARRKPVVVYKGGRTEAGKRAAFGHTASLTSSVAVFEALCRQAGAIQVESVEEMIDVLVMLRFATPLPRGRGVALFGAGGGPNVMASDEVERAGLDLPRLSDQAQAEMRGLLPVDGSIFSNPVDTPNLATPEGIATVARILSRVPEVDTLLYHLGFHPISRWGSGRFASKEFLQPAVAALTATRQESATPVLVAMRPPLDVRGMEEFVAARDAFVAAGLPVFHALRDAATAISRVAAYAAATSEGTQGSPGAAAGAEVDTARP